MPQMANITVKNKAGADVVYNAGPASAGDKSPARWSQNTASGIFGHRPTFTVVTSSNGNNNARKIEATLKFPIVEDRAGVPTIIATVPLSMSGTLPTNVMAVSVEEAFIQFGNLLSSTLLRGVAAEGYAPS